MESAAATALTANDIFALALIAALFVCACAAIFLGCLYWFRKEQRRWEKRILRAVTDSGRAPEELFLTGKDAIAYGELIAQFKVNQGKQVVSVLESDGKRFIHVVGELSPNERTKMVRYLKSEGFMS
jgi:hypothetical protein